MKHEQCVSCVALQQELLQLRELSEQRARQDHDQCVGVFQQMQELVRLNESLTRSCNRAGGRQVDVTTLKCGSSIGSDSSEEVEDDEADSAQIQIQRLQTIIMHQAKELETFRRRQRDATADGRIQPVITRLLDSQRVEDQLGLDSNSDDEEVQDNEDTHSEHRSVTRRHANQLHRLPLTSLHAQLKGKDLQLQRLQQIIAKLDTRFGQLIDSKRSMALNFQQTARTQQAHLKKYLAYIQQQTAEKKALERQLRELKEYIDVLEKKVVSLSLRTGNRHEREIISVKLRDVTCSRSQLETPSHGCFKDILLQQAQPICSHGYIDEE